MFGNVFMQLDSVVGSVNSVLFGSTNLAKLPVSELVHFFGLNLSVCNRSIDGLSPSTALSCLNECVLMLNPQKVFLGFGDELTDFSETSINSYIKSYEELINQIAIAHDCEIYILSPVGNAAEMPELAGKIRNMAEDVGCNYIDISDCIHSDRPMLSLFKRLGHYIRDSRISFAEAMELAAMSSYNK